MENMHQFLVRINKTLQFASKEQKSKQATNSELHRWIKQGALQINGEICNDPKESLDFPFISAVLFPKSNKRCTLL